MSNDVMTPSRQAGTGRPARADQGSRPGQAEAAPGAGPQPRPARRPRPRPVHPAGPVRPASPVRPAGPGRPGRTVRTGGPARPEHLAQQAPAEQASLTARLSGRTGARQAGQLGRTSFVVLVLGLLGGGLVCLLVVNTTLAANSIQISNLQQANTTKTQLVQELQRQVAADSSAAVIEKEAQKLGMRPESQPVFLDLRHHSIKTRPGSGSGHRSGTGHRPGSGPGHAQPATAGTRP